LSEVSGGVSSGKASVALAACRRALREGHGAAWIDPGLGFCPLTLAESGEASERFLCVRTANLAGAMKAADLLLRGSDAADAAQLRVVALQLPPREQPSVPALIRLHRLIAHTGASLVVVDERSPEGGSLAPVVHLRLLVHRTLDGVIQIESVRGGLGSVPLPADFSPMRFGRTM
jgi:hypothetical protein